MYPKGCFRFHYSLGYCNLENASGRIRVSKPTAASSVFLAAPIQAFQSPWHGRQCSNAFLPFQLIFNRSQSQTWPEPESHRVAKSLTCEASPSLQGSCPSKPFTPATLEPRAREMPHRPAEQASCTRGLSNPPLADDSEEICRHDRLGPAAKTAIGSKGTSSHFPQKG